MDIKQLIAQGESDRMEFKTTLEWDVRQNKRNTALRHSVLKTLAAFLNTRGGTLIIGVEDDGSIYGLEQDLALLKNSRDRFAQHFANLVRTNLGPQYAPLIQGRFEEVDGKVVYVVDVKPAPEPVFLKGDKGKEFFCRFGTTTQRLDPEETHGYIKMHWSGQVKKPDAKAEGGTTAMRAFHTIAIPHDDILQGRLTMGTFAADLWQVYRGEGIEEYRDPTLFFKQTYLTNGLRNLFDVVEKRLKGEGGDPVIQMQTPFGGGKTHSLIALYHKAHEWGVKPVVISGTPLASDETLWGLMAEQLTGSRDGFEGKTSPGRDAIQQLLSEHQPVLILMDEVLEYVTKAAGVPVGQSTLAAQTLAFMQELTEAVGLLEKTVIVITLPSSALEHYDEQAARLFEQLKKISGRVEKIYTPVQDEEVGPIIRRRLFSRVDEQAATQIINDFVDQAQQEAILARGEESSDYRQRFKDTYPFLPEVVDVLYHRWGSFPSFQRTRGTLRLLALVISALKTSSRPYISLADFDLNDDEIRRELLNHIDSQYDSVLAADITGAQSGARRANLEIGKSYQGLRLGERVATTIFMYSFVGGGGEAGATLGEIKRQNLISGVPASVIAEVLQKLSGRLLFYLHEHAGRYYFSTTANLNRALTIRMDSLSAEELRKAEQQLLGRSVSGRSTKIKTFIWPENHADIVDDETPKLLIFPEPDRERMKEFLQNKGQTPRVHRNTLYFLAPIPTNRAVFEKLLRQHLALSDLMRSETISLTSDQRQQLSEKAHQVAKDVQEQILGLYRLLYLPDPNNGLQEVDMGIATYGADQKLDELVYERLRTEGRLVEKLAPLVIKARYLANRDFVETHQLAEIGSRTPGEVLAVNRRVWENSIAEGVRQGLFGLGELTEENQPKCLYFKKEPSVSLQGREILIRAEICEQQQREQKPGYSPSSPGAEAFGEGGASPDHPSTIFGTETPTPTDFTQPTRSSLTLKFRLPFGQASSLLGLLNLLQQRFHNVELTIHLTNGSISDAEIEDKVRETFRQMGADVEIE